MNADGQSRAKSADGSVASLTLDAGSTPGTPGRASGGDEDGAAGMESASISVSMHNIRQFKETVVNTSRLLKVFGDQEKELAKAKAELARHHEDARRVHTAHQGLQRELDARARELASANAETDNARSLLSLREEELSRVRGLKEDLEARIAELRQAAPAVAHSAPPTSPSAAVVEENERLKRELESKEGSLKSLRISRDSIRSSTKAEIMSIQARYAREQKELTDRLEREMADHRASLAGKEAELEQEQERLMQLEMDLGMRETQMEEQASELTAAHSKAVAERTAAQQANKKLEDLLKARTAEHRTELTRLQRKLAKDEKRISELEAQLGQAKAKAGESARARSRQRPRSTATAAEAVQAATEDVAGMSIDDLRAEVAALRVDAVHNEETIRRLQVMNAELQREQNPEGHRRRPRAAVQQAQIDELTKELELRDRKVAALEETLRLTEPATHGDGGGGDGSATGDASQAVSRIAQLNMQVISLEAAARDKEQAMRALEADLQEARAVPSERPMRLRNAPTPTSMRRAPPTTTGDGVDAPQGPCAQHYAEIAGLRARVDRFKQEKAALQELVTDQQVKIRQLRLGSGAVPPASPTAAQRKRGLPLSPPLPAREASPDRAATAAVAAKRARRALALGERGGTEEPGSTAVATPPRKQAVRARRAVAGPAGDAPDARFAERHEPHEIGPVLANRRILDSTRTRRFFSLVGSSPLALPTALARMAGRVPALDSAKLVELLVAHAHAEPARLMPSTQRLTDGEPGAVAAGLAALADGLQPGLYAHEAAVALSVWALALRCEQTTLYDDFMRGLAAQLVLRASGPVPAACSLARVFAALGFLATDVQRVRAMLCDLLMEAGDGPHALPVLANALAVWPAALAAPPAADAGGAPDGQLSFALIVRVVQAIAAGIHDLYAGERGAGEADALYAVMVERCGWQQPGEAEFADTLLVEVKDTLGRLPQDSADYPVAMTALNLLAPYVA